MDDAFFARRGLTLDRLRTFLAVADAGGIAMAAPTDATKQSQISRQIGELEEFFETALFERRGKGIALTAAGAELDLLLREFFARLRDVGTKTPGPSIDVTVGAGDSMIQWWIFPNNAAFGRARLEVITDSGHGVAAGLLDAQYDLGILRASELRPGLRSRMLGTVEYALYVPKSYIPKRKNVGVKELLEHLPIGIVTGEPSFSERLGAALARAKVRLNPAVKCVTFPQLCAAVAEGMCAAVLPTVARRRLKPGTFREYRDPILGKHEGRMCLAWPTRLEWQRPRVAALIPGIVEGMQRLQ